MNRPIRLKYRSVVMLSLALMIISCADRISSNRATTLRLSVSLAGGSWQEQNREEGGRFITPDVTTVYVEARSGTAEGDLVLSTELSVNVDGDGIAGAAGQLALPIGQPLVLLALIKDAEGTVIAKASSEPVTLESAPSETPVVSLIILPLENNPDLVDLSPGMNSVSIPAGKSKILRFSTNYWGGSLKWAMSAYPSLRYQLRNETGNAVRATQLANDGGIGFLLEENSTNYVLVNNNGTAALENIPFELALANPLIVSVNVNGSAFVSKDSILWDGPYSTGLTLANDITYANGLFVAVGQIGTNYGVSTSSDGIAWTPQNLGGTSALLMRVRADSSGHLVTDGYYGVSHPVFNSDDGVTWTGPSASLYTGSTGAGPVWADGFWYISTSTTVPIYKSSNGVTWNSVSGSTVIYQAHAVIGVNEYVVIGGGAGSNASKQTITLSNDGVTFGAVVSFATHYIQAFAAHPTTFRVLAVGSGTTAQINYSDDYGATWTTSTGTGTNAFRAASWWKGGFLAGDSAGNIYGSTDGASFTLAGSAGTAELRGIAYNDAP